MKKIALLISVLPFLFFPLFSQNYEFNETISEEVLRNYLDRSITMSGLSEIEGNPPTEQERQEEIDMLLNIEAKFIGRMGSWWESGWGQNRLDQIFANVVENVCDLKAGDSEVICQGAIFEYVSPTVETFNVPEWVFNEFNLPVQSRTFDYEAMLYPENSQFHDNNVPDMSQLETQLWFYYMARRYIDSGCEAIHFGRVEIMNSEDAGNQSWWEMLTRVRNYAASLEGQQMPCGNTNAIYRGMVLCDAHTDGEVLNNSDVLLFDFHSSPLRIQGANPSWGGDNGGGAVIDLDHCGARYGQSIGGTTPSGWTTTSLPILFEFDNFGISDAPNQNDNPNSCFPWGWDEITWFALQDEVYRNDWLRYVYYQVKCFDPNAHVEMPGRRRITETGATFPFDVYRAAMGTTTNHYNQANTIRDIWNSVHQNFDWGYFNFQEDRFSSQSTTNGSPMSDLLRVGDDRFYYIAQDNTVHGFVFSDGLWRPVSPSWSAHFNGTHINTQIRAASNLIANPDGDELFYIGTDGLVYQFRINSIWSYTYSTMPTNEIMTQQGITAIASLIHPVGNRIYYIADDQRVHGFINNGNSWSGTFSPSAQASLNGVDIEAQVRADSTLISNPAGDIVFYVGIDGLIYRYIFQNGTYTYADMPTNEAMTQQDKIVTGSLIHPLGDRIYYVANDQRIHGLINNGTTWSNTVSPSWSAHFDGTDINAQLKADGELVTNIDGTMLFYNSSDGQLAGFMINTIWDYEYFRGGPA